LTYHLTGLGHFQSAAFRHGCPVQLPIVEASHTLANYKHDKTVTVIHKVCFLPTNNLNSL